MSIKVRVNPGEPIHVALRRFKKMIERSGLMREIRSREAYQKPSTERRVAEGRKEANRRKAERKATQEKK